ncbi:MAG: hypothetical protein ACK4MW_01915 [Aquificaceae bacterium]
MLEIKERDPLSNLILEVLEDPSKKEMVYYLVCYSQLVKREASSTIELSRFLSCAYRNFQRARSYWKDLLVSMNLFVISDLYGNLYTGKDIYKVEEEGLYFIGIRHEYINQLEEINHKVLKLWNLLSKINTYRKYITPQDAVIISSVMFNDGLYEEVENYCEVCLERFPSEKVYFRVLSNLSKLYSKEKAQMLQELKRSIKDLEELGDVYYGINLFKLRKDMEGLVKRTEKGGSINPIKIEFISFKRKGSFFERIVRFFKRLFKKLFNKKGKSAYYFGGEVCLKSSQTLFTNS